MIAEILFTAVLALGIPLVAVRYRRTRGEQPTDREKWALFSAMSVAWFVSSFVVDNPWGLFDGAYTAYRPLTSGITIGLSVLLLCYIRAYGWVGSDEDSTNQRNAAHK